MITAIFTEDRNEVMEFLNKNLKRIPIDIISAVDSKTPYSICVDYNPELDSGVVSFGYTIITTDANNRKFEVCRIYKGDLKNV